MPESQPDPRRAAPSGGAVAIAEGDPPRHDLLTVVALTIIAGALATGLHEFAGHGGFCVLTGGRMELVSSVNFDCSTESRWMMAGGTIVNFAAGAIAWLWMRRLRPDNLRFLLWITMTLNWLVGSGYFLYSGVANFGDWANIVAGWRPAWAWRLGLVAIGAPLYRRTMYAMNANLRPFLPPAQPALRHTARSLMLTAYFTYGIFSVLAALFNPVGMRLIAVSAAAASFGGACGLAWGWQFFRDASNNATAHGVVTRSYGWIAAATVVTVFFIFVLGPGIKLG